MSVSECVCESDEEGGREGGGGRGADTELKTKTPHVNVGNNTNIIINSPMQYDPCLKKLFQGIN